MLKLPAFLLSLSALTCIPINAAVPFLSARSYAYIENIAGQVQVLDTSNNTVIATISGIGNYNAGIAVNPAGTRVYVADDASGASDGVGVINAITNAVIAQHVGTSATNPVGIVVNPSGTYAYVALASGSVRVMDLGTNTFVATIPTNGVNAAAITPGGDYVYVTSSDRVYVISTATNTIVKTDRKSTRLNSSHTDISRMPSSA